MTPIEIIDMVGPEFKMVGVEQIAKWVELTGPLVSKKRFGKLYDQALALLACHHMKMAGLGDNPDGTVADSVRITSYAEGGRSVSYAQAPTLALDGDLALTTYGLQYLSLRRRVIVPITISRGRSV